MNPTMQTNEIWLVTISAPFSGDELIREAPLALMYLSGALKEKGYATRIWDLLEADVEGFLAELSRACPLFIGISSSYGIWAELTTKLAHRIKGIAPQLPIIVGGINVTCSPEPYLKESCYDYLALGEGEVTIQEFAQAISAQASIENIPGLAYRKEASFAFNAPRQMEKNMAHHREAYF